MQPNSTSTGMQLQGSTTSTSMGHEPGELVGMDTRLPACQRNTDLLTLLQSLSNTSLLLGPAMAQFVPRLLEPLLAGSDTAAYGAAQRDSILKTGSTTGSMVQLFQTLAQSFNSTQASVSTPGSFDYGQRTDGKPEPVNLYAYPSHCTTTTTTTMSTPAGTEQTNVSPKPEPHRFHTPSAPFGDNRFRAQTSPNGSATLAGDYEQSEKAAIGCVNPESVNGLCPGHSNAQALKPGAMNSFQPKPATNWSKLGVPQPATPTRFTAPVHVDVGGTLYTSSLETLTK
ncbi:unnamed protein product [Echinostoma caproni]|uniref:BTB_2 domain-containing protein n=1 Tax=Echinostoma caproni TaxID=27848 RepID=A0A183A8W4_9TREM|nr:unnamed protein product [Echinostoma caproni]